MARNPMITESLPKTVPGMERPEEKPRNPSPPEPRNPSPPELRAQPPQDSKPEGAERPEAVPPLHPSGVPGASADGKGVPTRLPSDEPASKNPPAPAAV